MHAHIIGTGMTAFGMHKNCSVVDLATQAAGLALDDASVRPSEVDALYVGNFLGQSLQHQGVIASFVAHRLGLRNVPATTVEGACASAGIALRHGIMACKAGDAAVALCIGAELLTPHPVPEVTRGFIEAMDQATDGAAGLTFPGFFGLVASAYMSRYGATREQLAAVPVKNRAHAAGNPIVMFSTPVTLDDVLASRLIADPLRVYDCSPISDGAAAAVVSNNKMRNGREAVSVLACEQACGPVSIGQIDDLTTFPATRAAAEQAYRHAGVGPEDIDVVELHDCFSIAEVIDCEDLGLLPRGEAASAITEGKTAHASGQTVVNPSGGLLARGHPVGATGLAQIHELVHQLRGEAHRQVDGAEIALAHNLGGTGATTTVTILAKENGEY